MKGARVACLLGTKVLNVTFSDLATILTSDLPNAFFLYELRRWYLKEFGRFFSKAWILIVMWSRAFFFSDRDVLYAGGMKGGYNPLVANLKPKRIAPHFPGLGHEQSIRCGFAFCSPRCTVVLAPSRLLWVWKMHRGMRESVLLHSSKNRNTLYTCVYRKYKRPRLTYHIKKWCTNNIK